MLRKLSAFILLSVSASAASVYGQQAPAPERLPQRSVQRILVALPFAGAYLGVQMLEVTKENFSDYNLREVRGVAVQSVVKDSPAARAGLQKGDVIARFNGEEVTSVFKLTRLLGETAPDHLVKLIILRGGVENELTVTAGKREPRAFPNGGFNMNGALPENFEVPRFPMPPAGSFPLPYDGSVLVFRTGANRRIGVGVTVLSKQLADYFGIADGKGLLIDNVRENSPAARAGLRASDVIVEADSKTIKTDADLIRALNDKKDGDIVLTVVRDKNRRTINVTPEVSKSAPARFDGFENFNQPNNFRMQTPAAPITPLPPIQPLKPLQRIL